MLPPSLSADTTAQNLQRLIVLRSVVIGCELIVLLLATHFLGMQLPLVPLLGVIAMYATINIVTWRQLKNSPRVSAFVFTWQLAFDTLAFAMLLYFSGGYTNPFVSLFLLPLVISASFLPQRHTVVMALLTISCYSLLMFFYVPLPQMHVGHHGSEFDVHVLGMWFSFLLNTALIVFFVVRMANSLRERDRHLAQIREKALQDEHLVELGTLATGAAHELGTPLSTMAVLIRDLSQDYASDPELAERTAILRSQIDRCKSILSDISASAGQTRAEGGRRLAVDDYLGEVIQQWLALRPGVQAKVNLSGTQPVPLIVGDKTLSQAIINILNNASDVSFQEVIVNGVWTNEDLTLDVLDCGPGISDDMQKSLGTPFLTTKKDGHGLGLYLAKSVIARLNGSINMTNRSSGGARVTITLPLQRLEIKT